jgi:hypothetical protein
MPAPTAAPPDVVLLDVTNGDYLEFIDIYPPDEPDPDTGVIVDDNAA